MGRTGGLLDCAQCNYLRPKTNRRGLSRELSLKNSFRGGAFIGCSNYPECKFTRPLSKAKAAQQSQLTEPKLIWTNGNTNLNDNLIIHYNFDQYV